MDVPSAGAGVLAQPTRARLFALLQELPDPVTTEVLAARLKLHPNGVRRQLNRLRHAGLVERRTVGHGRGRPRNEWAIAPDASPDGERPRGYRDLATWLARATVSSSRSLREVERVGREIGREIAPSGPGDPSARLQRILATLGFQPALEAGGDRVTCRLCNCPYRDAVRENQEVVCGLHRGLTTGLLDGLAPGARLSKFEPQDPDRAGCLVEVTGLANTGGG